MNIALRKSWTQDQFLAWAGHNEGRYEFDGFQPVAMTNASVNHGRIAQNLYSALRSRLRGSMCESMGPDAGVETVGSAIRYPDGLVTCSKMIGTAYKVPGVVVLFEIVSPSSGRIDRIIKVREYAAVDSIRRYVIIETTGLGLTLFHRATADEPWFSETLAEADDVLHMPEIGIEIPVGELYERVAFEDATEAG
jgi:Uma2 family endonuclease